MKLLKVFILMSTVVTLVIEIGKKLFSPRRRAGRVKRRGDNRSSVDHVSLAGAARRTVRRCVIGVYSCNIHGTQGSDSLAGQIV